MPFYSGALEFPRAETNSYQLEKEIEKFNLEENDLDIDEDDDGCDSQSEIVVESVTNWDDAPDDEFKAYFLKRGLSLDRFHEFESAQPEKTAEKKKTPKKGALPAYIFLTPKEKKAYFNNLNARYYNALTDEKGHKPSCSMSVKFKTDEKEVVGKASCANAI